MSLAPSRPPSARPRRLCLAAALVAAATAACLAPATASSKTFTLRPLKARSTHLVFRIKGIEPRSIVAARLYRGHHLVRKLRLRQIRLAARSGYLRLTVPKRVAAQHHGSGVRAYSAERPLADRLRVATDNTPPETTITSGPSGTVNSRDASFSFTSSERRSTFACQLDGGAWVRCSSPKLYSGLLDGAHRFQVRATDRAGNVDPTPAARDWTIQTAQPPPGDAQPGFPIRAAFYYPWFPEAWNQNGMYPYTKYTPTAGLYDSSSVSVIQQHIRSMEYAHIEAGIASWWGQGSRTDGRIPTLLSSTTAMGSGFRWALYYEHEAGGDPSATELNADLRYIRDRYGADPSYLRVNGRFVVFVYADGLDGCGMVDRWKQANADIGAYLVLKVFSGYRTCLNRPDGWHQYAPAVATDSQAGYSFSISPGFNKADESSPRLARDLTRWNQNIRDMVASNAPFQLITTMNEWGEGTSVESAGEWRSASSHGLYIDALHADGQVSPPPPDTTPPAAPTGLIATPGDQVVGLDWNDNSEPDLSGYRVYRRNADGSWPTTPTATPTGSQWSDSGRTNGTTYTYRVTALDGSGNESTPSSTVSATPLGSTSPDPVIAAAGDIACSPASGDFNGGLGTSSTCRQKYTSDLLVGMKPAAVLALGDAQYESGTLSEFQQSYDPSWGRVKSITFPAVGNHEYHTSNASGYFDYFNGVGNQVGRGGDRSKGYYSFNVGSWHIIALNSNCSPVGGCGSGSPQETWLRNDLAANPAKCTLAYWHHARFSSGGEHGDTLAMQPIWQALYDANADLVLAGHDHDYERFAPQTATGAADSARGIREFVVGTGGKSHYAFATVKPNSEVRQSDTYGVLKLTLHPQGYDWRFVPEAGKTFSDSGSASCH
jgi:acid phosphatase type 7